MNETLELIYKKLEEKQAIDVKILDISEISIMADYFVIASASSNRQLNALKDLIDEELSKKGLHLSHLEGNSNANWLLMDYGNIVIHLFDKESRAFYDLEHIWKGGRYITFE